MASSAPDSDSSGGVGNTLPPPPARMPENSAARVALAELAFGHLSSVRAEGAGVVAPLALLPSDALELDLSDPLQRQFGEYELLERIGQGGMGMVYRARQVALDREVAIKLLAAGPWASREFVQRFLDEARHAARMQHPNIVTVYEVGTAEDLHFFSMRLVRGRSLAAALAADGPFEPRRAAALLCTVAEAVAYAHSLNVLHLDLKPANVLLDEQETPHVADFGLARQVDPLRETDNTEISGTPSYMAPEQAEIGTLPLSPATDIWGLGAILYDLVTGEPPFRADTAQSTLSLVRVNQVRRPRQTRPQLPLDLEAIILRCLARDPQQRYPSARALVEDLTRYMEGFPVRARPLNTVRRVGRWIRREPRLAAMVLLVAGSLVGGLAATTQQWQRAEANAHRAEASSAQSSERLWAGRREAALRLMHDGKGFQALVPLLDNIEEQERSGRIDPLGVERREIGMILSQGVNLIDRMIVPDATPLASALSADGRLLALAFNDFSVRWYDADTLTERGRVDLSDVPTSDGETRLPRRLHFIDARRLLVTLDWFDYLASPSHNDSHLVDLERAEVIALPDAFADPAEAVFSADGSHALLRDRDDRMQLWKLDPWRPLSPLRHRPRSPVWAALLGRSGRFLAEKEQDANGYLTLRDPQGDAPPQPVAGLNAAITAWAESNDGSQLAVGDSRGHVFLVDVATRAARQLPTPSGREVTWVAFSQDDTWVAAARWDGAAFVFDAASGDPVHAGQIQNGFEAHEVAIDRSERLLAVAGLGHSALWRLPEEGPNPLDATRLISSPSNTGRAGTNALGMALEARLFASADMNGDVRLWRVAPPPPLVSQTQADGPVGGNLHFDGAQVPDIAWNQVRMLGIDGRTATPWRAFDHPITFAEASSNPRRLVVVAGSRLHVLDAANLLPRLAPVPLQGTPLHLTIDAGGSIAVLGYGYNDFSGFSVDIQVVDLDSGARRAQAHVRGPLRQFELSPDGTRLLVAGPSDGATTVFSAADLEVLGTRVNDPNRPVTWASFIPDSDALWLLARDPDDSMADDADLLRWDPRGGVIAERRHVAGVFPVAVSTIAGRPLLASRDRDLFDAGAPGEVAFPVGTRSETTAVFAHSHDGRLLAHAIGRDVQLYDTATLAPVGPPLHSNAGSYVLPVRLAFSPDDRTLLGGFRPWLSWPVAADARPLEQLREQARLLIPPEGSRNLLQLADPAQRARLRQADSGAPPAAESRPGFTSARQVRGLAIPARDPAATPLQIDLTQAYNRPTDLRIDVTSSAIPFIGMRLGLARLDGVDYDLRGAIELRTHGVGGYGRVRGIPVPALRIAALNVLLFAPLAAPAAEVRDYAYIRLNFADGSHARLPIRTQIDVPGLTGHDPPTPIGWVRSDFLRQIGSARLLLISNPRLTNPHPEKSVVSLDLETPQDQWSNPVFFAITAEPSADPRML